VEGYILNILGGAWCAEINCRVTGQGKAVWLTNVPDYLDRRDCFKKSRWEGHRFIITDNLGAEVVLLDQDNEKNNKYVFKFE